jgi:hypothetical protein
MYHSRECSFSDKLQCKVWEKYQIYYKCNLGLVYYGENQKLSHENELIFGYVKMKKQFHICDSTKICNTPLTITAGFIENLKLSKGNELKTSKDNSLRTTPISTGPARSEGNGCASPNLKFRDDSIEYYNY